MSTADPEALPEVVLLVIAAIEKNPNREGFTDAERKQLEQALLRPGPSQALKDAVSTLIDYAIFLEQSALPKWASAVTMLIRAAIPALESLKDSRGSEVASTKKWLERVEGRAPAALPDKSAPAPEGSVGAGPFARFVLKDKKLGK